MKMYLPFGDWSGNGHGHYEKILIDAPSMEHLYNAQLAIKRIYGDNFFKNFAQRYEITTLEFDIWEALMDTNYPMSRMLEYDDSNDWTGVANVAEAYLIDPKASFSIEFIIDAFIWLLNAFGAEIVRLDDKEAIPMICNWTCPGFETVGYGTLSDCWG